MEKKITEKLQAEKLNNTSLMPEEILLIHLRQCGRILRHSTEGKASRRRILAILDAHGSIAQSELKDILRIQPGSLSEILGKIEAEGCIQRVRSVKDKRSVKLSLTEEGEITLKELNRLYDEEIRTLFSVLNAEELNWLNTLLGKLTADWENNNLQAVKGEKRPVGRPRKKNHEVSDV